MTFSPAANNITYTPAEMTRKVIKSIQELGEFFKCGDAVDARSNSNIWAPFNRIFRVSMKSSKMAIPKSFEAKLTRWFHLPGDQHEEESIKRAEFQTVGWYLCFSFFVLFPLFLLENFASLLLGRVMKPPAAGIKDALGNWDVCPKLL